MVNGGALGLLWSPGQYSGAPYLLLHYLIYYGFPFEVLGKNDVHESSSFSSLSDVPDLTLENHVMRIRGWVYRREFRECLAFLRRP